jgi:hypothetical protein
MLKLDGIWLYYRIYAVSDEWWRDVASLSEQHETFKYIDCGEFSLEQ